MDTLLDMIPSRPLAAESVPPSSPKASEQGAELDRILAAGLVASVFQPIVEIETQQTIGYEALARGPHGSPLERPDLLFAAARDANRLAELDWLCRARAVSAAIDAGLGRATSLFINCEPSVIGTPPPSCYADLWSRAQRELNLVLEITERAVSDRPAELCRETEAHRGRGCGIALDDLGADTRSLALLPIIEPDVIKLDLRLVQRQPSLEQAAIVSAVAAESERTGAAVLAEGVETDEHLQIARALGATLGQGYLWGRPKPLGVITASAWTRPLLSRGTRSGRTPFDVVAAHNRIAIATKRQLLAMSLLLEDRALAIGEGAVLLSAFQHARHFTPATIERYETLARHASLVGAFATGLRPRPAPGVRGATIDPDDPLVGEWSVVVIGPHFSGSLVAQDLGDRGPQRQRRFRFTTTYRRDLVIAAAHTLIQRVAPAPTAPPRASAPPQDQQPG